MKSSFSEEVFSPREIPTKFPKPITLLLSEENKICIK